MFARLFGIGDLDREAFAALYVKLGKKEGLFEDPEIDVEGFSITEGEMVHNLGNIYPQFLSLPRRRRRGFLLHLLSGWRDATLEGSLPESWEQAQPMLLPRLRDAGYLSAVDIESCRRDSPDMLSAYEELAPGLFLTLVIDAERTMASVSSSMLDKWGVSLSDALEVARRNLLDNTDDGFELVAPGVWVSTFNDSYAASRLTLPHVIQRVTTDPIVCVPNRDLILLCEPRRPGALDALIAILEKVSESESYPITRRLYQLEGTEYAPFELPEDSPLAVAHHNLCVIERAHCYDQQKAGLQEVLGPEVFVASLSVYRSESGELFTGAVWIQGVDTLLPEADVIHCLELDPADTSKARSIHVVPWSELLARDLITPTDDILPRWQTSDFPDPELLAEIGDTMPSA